MSYDIYPIGSKTPQVKGKLDYVARGVINQVKRASPDQSIWMALETTALDPTHRPTATEVRAEVWIALIHGATGIFYFVHEFEPRRAGPGCLNRISASISGASAGVRLPCGWAAM